MGGLEGYPGATTPADAGIMHGWVRGYPGATTTADAGIMHGWVRRLPWNNNNNIFRYNALVG